MKVFFTVVFTIELCVGAFIAGHSWSYNRRLAWVGIGVVAVCLSELIRMIVQREKNAR